MTCFELDVAGARAHLVGEGEGPARWAPGASGQVVPRLCWSTMDAMRLARGELSGTEAMAATRLLDANASELGTALPPMTFVRQAALVGLPRQFGATLRVQVGTTDGPFGPFAFALDLDDGLPVRERFTTLAAADVIVTLRYAAVASVFAGRMSVLEAIADGEVVGELAALAAFAGFLETDECRALMARAAPRALGLVALGDLRASPAFAAALAHITAPASTV